MRQSVPEEPCPAGGACGDDPGSLRLAELTPADLAGCLALDRASLGGLWSEAQWLRELEEARRPGVGLFRGEELRALATGWLVLDELHITAVVVAPTWRRRGLGARVLMALLRRSLELGAERATLEVAAGNQAARRLYASLGFREAGVRHRYYSNGDDALIQWRNLTRGLGTGNR
ncbi:MAG: GNAT family N-acetyltransferase [Cyanobacteriota bacterium]|nr:GNAT family N-acetyltransferase [Cyanobacteriota bacterium]